MAYKPLSNWDPNGPVGAPPAVWIRAAERCVAASGDGRLMT